MLSASRALTLRPLRALPAIAPFSMLDSTPRTRNEKPRRHWKNRKTLATAATATVTAPYSKHRPGPQQDPAPAPAPVSSATHESNFSKARFSDFVANGQISEQLLRGIPFEFCTHVQAKTLTVLLNGVDVLARAKTGTGKTLAFLLPVIQKLAASTSTSFNHISALILSPTRELAQQIQKEAQMVLDGAGLNQQIGVQCVFGGTNVNTDVQRLKQQRADILVATPGRLLDLIQHFSIGPQLSNVKYFILDEADRLLDQGFKKDLEAIVQALPNRAVIPRQTLFFSATIPPDVLKIAQLALLPNHQHISTLSESDTATHAHVKQYSLILPHTEVFPALASVLAGWIAGLEGSRAKVMVFANTARATALLAKLFSELDPNLGPPIYTIHSRLSQPKRTAATEAFKNAQSAILFTSDVTARGIDVPGVTGVVQVGLPSSEEQYIHRLGRTARAGQSGTGILILADFEQFFLRRRGIADLGIQHWVQEDDGQWAVWREKIARAMDRIEKEPKEQAYQAWLGLYKSSLKDIGWDPRQLVNEANAFARDILLYKGADAERADGYVVESTGVVGGTPWKPPPILTKTAGKMGIKNGKALGLNLVKQLPEKL